MKTFSGHVSVDQLKARCKKLGLVVDSTRYDKNGDDFVVVRGATGPKGKKVDVLYSSFNGRFYGGKGASHFSSDDDAYDEMQWFCDLLALFYTEKVAA